MAADLPEEVKRRPTLTINIPNILTVLRILITPLFVIFLIRKMHGHALLVFIFAGVSDGLDGLIARLLNQRSDVLADFPKLLRGERGQSIPQPIPFRRSEPGYFGEPSATTVAAQST